MDYLRVVRVSWFCKKYRICAQCRVHFEPDMVLRHPELCPEHRKPVVELELRKELVARWAAANWEKLEPQAKEDEAKMRSAFGLGDLAQMQVSGNTFNAAASPLGSMLGGIVG